MQKPTQVLQSVKEPGNIFDINSKWTRTLPSLIYCSWDIYRDPLHNYFFKYQSWYLTSCCGLEVQKPTLALKSIKGQDNTFDLNPKWARTLLSLIYFSGEINRDLPPQINIKYQSWYLTPCCGFEVQNLTQALQSIKGQGNTFDLIPKCATTLPSLIYCSLDINRDPPQQYFFQISKLIFDTLLWVWGAETHPGT